MTKLRGSARLRYHRICEVPVLIQPLHVNTSAFDRLIGLRRGGDINALPQFLVGPPQRFNDPRGWWHGHARLLAQDTVRIFHAAGKTVSFKYNSKALLTVKKLLNLGGVRVTETALRRYLGR